MNIDLAGLGFIAFAIAGMVMRRRNAQVSAILWIAAWLMFAIGFYVWFANDPRYAGFLR
jgi:uncharacterized protein involved in response to NO